MTRSQKVAASSVLVGAAVITLGSVAAAPAFAHTNDIYSFQDNLDGEGDSSFVTLDRVSGAAAPLPTTVPAVQSELFGIEVHDEQGWALVSVPGEASIAAWDHVTGGFGEGVPLVVPGLSELDSVSGLDTLPDGTLLTTAQYRELDVSVEPPTTVVYDVVATIDPVTGALTPIVDFSDVNAADPEGPSYTPASLATDPIGGGTYVFFEGDDNGPSHFLAVDIAAGTHGELTAFEGEGFADGFFRGADFDGDGTLYFIYGNNARQEYELSTLGAPSAWPTAARSYVADAASNLEGTPLSELALALEYLPEVPSPTPTPEPTQPELAATGSDSQPGGLVAAGTVLLAGAVLMLAARIRRA